VTQSLYLRRTINSKCKKREKGVTYRVWGECRRDVNIKGLGGGGKDISLPAKARRILEPSFVGACCKWGIGGRSQTRRNKCRGKNGRVECPLGVGKKRGVENGQGKRERV